MQVQEIRDLFESVDAPHGVVDYPSRMFAEFQLLAHENNAAHTLQVLAHTLQVLAHTWRVLLISWCLFPDRFLVVKISSQKVIVHWSLVSSSSRNTIKEYHVPGISIENKETLTNCKAKRRMRTKSNCFYCFSHLDGLICSEKPQTLSTIWCWKQCFAKVLALIWSKEWV